MKKQTHHIQKQQVALDFESEEEALHWNRRFSEFYYSDILPRFNSLLDNTVPGDRSYVIDRLEIDLGTINMDEFHAVFFQKVEEELIGVLKNGSRSGLSADDTENSVFGDSAPQQVDLIERGESNRKEHRKNLRIKDSKEHILESLTHFLDYGVLPWSSKFDTLKELEAGLRQEIGIEKLTARVDFQEQMRITFVRKRFYFQFSKAFAEQIFNRVYSEERAALLSLQEELKKQLIRLAKDTPSRKKIKQELSKSIWPGIIEAGPVDIREWPQYFVSSAIETISPSLISPEEGVSPFILVMEKLSPSSPLMVHLKAIVDEKDRSQTFKESETSRDDSGMDKRNQKEAAATSPEDRNKTVDDKTSRDAEDDSVQKRADDAESDDETDKETSTSESLRQADEADPDLKKTGKSQKTKKSGDAPPPRHERDKPEPGMRHRETPMKSSPEERYHTGDSGNGGEAVDDSAQKFSDGTDGVDEETSPGEHSKQPDGGIDDPKKSKTSEAEHPGTTISEDTTISGTDADKESTQDHPKDLEEYYLRNAGIILSWPYLSRLFTNLEYLEDKVFKGPDYQQRAVHLLGYIGTGEEKCEEHELLLAKLLCAWSLQMPIIKELELTEKEKNSADEMLNNLISHWSVLKNTSVEGLRQSFFDRGGKLFKVEKNDQWRLIVEQKSYDMLLDHLPFSISMIKLPWMKEILKVDWA